MMDIIKRLEADSDLLSHCLHQRLDKGTSYITAGDINRLGETGLAARQEIDSLRAENEALRSENAELVECLESVCKELTIDDDGAPYYDIDALDRINPELLLAKHQTKGVEDGE